MEGEHISQNFLNIVGPLLHGILLTDTVLDTPHARHYAEIAVGHRPEDFAHN
jgi:hypothetical protein